MAFITNKKEQERIKIRNFNDFYRDAMNKGISIVPFDIFEYVNSFDDIELNINDKDLNFSTIGLVEKFQNGYGFLISISKFHNIKIQRMILARLFAHLVLHRDYIIQNEKIEIKNFWTSDIMHKEANEFASKLLMPKATFEVKCHEFRTFGELAEYFNVTAKMAKFRFENLWN